MSDEAARNERKIVARGWVLFTVCAGIALNCYFNFGPDSFGRSLLKIFQDPRDLRALKNIDRLYAEMLPGQNAFLSFKDFRAEDEAFIERVYYRSRYAAYPCKVFVAAPGTVVNHGRDILESPFLPNEEWLDQNRVSRVILYEQKEDGKISAVATARELR